MFPPDHFAFIWFQGLSFIRDDVSCDWKDAYLTKNEKIVVPNLRVDTFSFSCLQRPFTIIFAPCIFQGPILSASGVKSYLHRLPLPDFAADSL